jgi:hypothetical protein
MVRLGLLVVLATLSAGALCYVAAVPPDDNSPYPKCQLHSLTGLHCPGCGMTRSLHSILNGQFLQAMAYNLLSPILLPFLAITAVRSLWAWAWGEKRSPRRRWLPSWMPLVIGTVLLTFAVVRNIPVYPFTLLAPHELPVATAPPDQPES